MFDPPADKPQSVGDLVGRAFRIFRQGIPLYFQTLTGPTIVAALGGLAVQWVIIYGFSSLADKPTGWPICLLVFLTSLLILLITRWVLAIRLLCFLRMSGGFSTDYASALKELHKRQWMVLAVFLLAITFTVAVTIGGVVGFALTVALPRAGLAAMVLTMGSILLIFLSFIAAYYLTWITVPVILSVTVCEDLPLNASISRGINLVKNDLGRSIAFGTLLYVCLVALSYPLCLPLVGLEAADAFSKEMLAAAGKDVYKMPIYLMILSQIWESLLSMLIWPIAFLGYGLYYSDLRLRQEGLDISRNLEALSQRGI